MKPKDRFTTAQREAIEVCYALGWEIGRMAVEMKVNKNYVGAYLRSIGKTTHNSERSVGVPNQEEIAKQAKKIKDHNMKRMRLEVGYKRVVRPTKVPPPYPR